MTGLLRMTIYRLDSRRSRVEYFPSAYFVEEL
jgi:hypothetical protein